MSKSILVIDAPENRYNCGIRKGYSCGGVKVICGVGKTLPTNLEKPDWCPLKGIPKKKKHDNAIPTEKQWCFESISGWNACIDEILKGGKVE